MAFHRQDRFNLASFNADMDSIKLLNEYEKYQAAWKKSNSVGALPLATTLALAVKYQALPAKEVRKINEEKRVRATAEAIVNKTIQLKDIEAKQAAATKVEMV